MNTAKSCNAAWAIGVLVLCLQTAAISHAAPAKKSQDKATPTSATTKKSKSVKVKHQQNNSGESTAERDRRLYRECKGLPNAGACLGYTRR